MTDQAGEPTKLTLTTHQQRHDMRLDIPEGLRAVMGGQTLGPCPSYATGTHEFLGYKLAVFNERGQVERVLNFYTDEDDTYFDLDEWKGRAQAQLDSRKGKGRQ